MHSTRHAIARFAPLPFVFTVFARTFKDFKWPRAIRTDNGVPVASAHARYGLSKLSVWWLRLGIQIERITPGHPEQNGQARRVLKSTDCFITELYHRPDAPDRVLPANTTVKRHA